VDGTPFKIIGHIDRIDQREGELMILDYKTGTRKTPEQQHRRGRLNDKQWVDLQLPLYRALARDNGFPSADLAFICLGKKQNAIAFEQAKWNEDELAGAEVLTAEIIRNIRDGMFWPPADPPDYDDGLEYICMDRVIDREAIIAGVKR